MATYMKKLFNTLSTYLKMVRGYSISREEIDEQLLFILLEPKEKKPVSQILKDVLYIYHIYKPRYGGKISCIETDSSWGIIKKTDSIKHLK